VPRGVITVATQTQINLLPVTPVGVPVAAKQTSMISFSHYTCIKFEIMFSAVNRIVIAVVKRLVMHIVKPTRQF